MIKLVAIDRSDMRSVDIFSPLRFSQTFFRAKFSIVYYNALINRERPCTVRGKTVFLKIICLFLLTNNFYYGRLVLLKNDL